MRRPALSFTTSHLALPPLLLGDRSLVVLELRHRINDGDVLWGTVAVHQHHEHLPILGLEVIPPRDANTEETSKCTCGSFSM